MDGELDARFALLDVRTILVALVGAILSMVLVDLLSAIGGLWGLDTEILTVGGLVDRYAGLVSTIDVATLLPPVTDPGTAYVFGGNALLGAISWGFVYRTRSVAAAIVALVPGVVLLLIAVFAHGGLVLVPSALHALVGLVLFLSWFLSLIAYGVGWPLVVGVVLGVTALERRGEDGTTSAPPESRVVNDD